ncbi:MAG TPA: hypothetical protein DEH75_21530, partial [Bradyrhizobium sp.]|nr:hypothetical protein [Bradyrhizobium sp.]
MGEAVVIAAVREFANRFLGRGEATITVPSFDGALKPNQKLEAATTLLECEAPEDLATDGRNLYVADGRRLLRLDGGTAVELRSFEQPISALCALADGGLAVALGGREVRLYANPSSGEPTVTFSDAAFNAVNALAPADDGTLIATDGSTTCGVDDWARDLMELNRSGRVFRLDPRTRTVKPLASKLGYAFGACARGDGVLVSESWRHRLVLIGDGKAPQIVLGRLPVYPSRLSKAAGGGYWLTAFTARTQLIEFVLREPAYRRRMMAEIDPAYWVAPRLRSGFSFKEPMQGAHIKTMGVIKPWAPPRSYGLLVHLDAEGEASDSLHSRAGGRFHGITAACAVPSGIVIAA